MIELTGYSDPPSVAPGETVRFMVSTDQERYSAEVVRLIHGDRNPEGPGFKQEKIAAVGEGEFPGRRQPVPIGSYGVCPGLPAAADGFGLALWIYPTLLAEDSEAAVVWQRDEETGRGFGLLLEHGCLCLRLSGPGGEPANLRAENRLEGRRWYFVHAGLAGDGTATLEYAALDWPRSREAISARLGGARAVGLGGDSLFLAAAGTDAERRPLRVFDGKLDSPQLFSRPLTPVDVAELDAPDSFGRVGREALVAAWNLGAEPSGDRIVDVSGHGRHGTFVNRPAAAVTGRNWEGALDWKDAPEQFGAVHFHRDDLVDAGWDADLTWTVPEDARSGVYALWLRGGDEEDHVPFVVRPPRARATADVAVLLPTFTYLAYANERLPDSSLDVSGIVEREIEPDPRDLQLTDCPYGLSLYDQHADGSAVRYSSWRRPIPSLRPDHRHWLAGAPRSLGADLHLTDWLEEKGFAHDVFTDGDLHHDGLDLASRYRVLITGSHPEYWSERMMDALRAFLDRGGRLMYLGGNGFYWVTGADPENPHLIEVRRGPPPAQGSEAAGESHLSTTGEMGGLWRHRGRVANQMVGVGFAAQGWSARASGYRRNREATGPIPDLIFAGVEGDRFGEYGLSMSGAAGDELDSADPRRGTPPRAIVLASSIGFDDHYQVPAEEVLLMKPGLGGKDNPDVRADMAFMETEGEGAVFSTGSINWTASLSHDGYDNDVSRITENVLRAFLTVEAWSRLEDE